jgi:hypothetical protein
VSSPKVPKPAADADRGSAPVVVAAAKTPKPVNDPPKVPTGFADAEIAAAAQTSRPKGRKPAVPEPTSTVTPPPQAPKVAQINPKPAPSD